MQTSTSFQSYVASGIDAKTTGTTVMHATEAGNSRFVPLISIIECTNASAIIGVATISIGTNASTYNNILTASALTGLTAANKIIMFNNALTAIDSVAASTEMRVNVTVGATATTMTIKVVVLGYYLP